MNVGKRPNVVSRFWGYLKALNTFGKVITALSILFSVAQILQFLFPALVQSPFSDSKYVTVALSIAFAILLLVLVWSNFRLFDTHTSQGVAIEVREPSVHLSDGLLAHDQTYSLNPSAKLIVRVTIEVCNHQSIETSLRVTVRSLKCRWDSAEDIALTDVRTYLSGCSAQGRECKGDLVSLAARDIVSLSLDVHAPLAIVGDEGAFRRLGSLSAVTVTLAIQESGRKLKIHAVRCDAAGLHQSIRRQLETEIAEVRARDPYADKARRARLAETCREYWCGFAAGRDHATSL